jgi:hypothetical protein
MSMQVTYTAYGRFNRKIYSAFNEACFSAIFSRDVYRIDVLLKTSPANEDYKDFWLGLLKQIEPKLAIKKKKNSEYVSFKPKNQGRKRVFLTILRYLWEDENHYDIIVRLTHKILERYPDMDPMAAITIGSSSLNKGSGWGHSLVFMVARNIPKVWHYQRYEGTSVYKFTDTLGYPVLKEGMNKMKVFEKIKKEMKDDLDIEPILKAFDIETLYPKLIKNG